MHLQSAGVSLGTIVVSHFPAVQACFHSSQSCKNSKKMSPDVLNTSFFQVCAGIKFASVPYATACDMAKPGASSRGHSGGHGYRKNGNIGTIIVVNSSQFLKLEFLGQRM